jgi:hypothetical protein
MGNRQEPLARLVQAEQAGPPVWTSSFHISHRISTTLAAGGVYFAGDACVFAELVRTGRLPEYDRLRRPVDQRVVRRVEFLSRIASAESWFNCFMRSFMVPTAVTIPFVRGRMVATVTGLDHELPPGVADGAS